MSAFTQENSLLWYSDNDKYIEITTWYYIWWDEKSLSVEINVQGKNWDETYADLFISKKFLMNAQELANTIKAAINYLNDVTDLSLTPIDDRAVTNYAQNMAKLYGV